MTPLFHLENIVRNYPDPASRDPHAVRTVLNLSELDIRAGEILGIRGHNGSGKSTLLRIIALLEPPDSGTVLFEGRPAGTDDLHLRRQVTLLLQTPYLLSRSVASNVAYGLRVRGIRNASELQNRIAASLLAVGLDPAVFLHRRRHELSGGECQRVALAARLALRPRVLLMDEPTASVDQQSAERIALAARHAADFPFLGSRWESSYFPISCLFQLLQQIIDVEASPCIRGGILFLPVAQYISFPVGQAL